MDLTEKGQVCPFFAIIYYKKERGCAINGKI